MSIEAMPSTSVHLETWRSIMSGHVLQFRPLPLLCLVLLLGSCSRPTLESGPVEVAEVDSKGREKLLSVFENIERLEYTIFKVEDEDRYARLGPIIVDSPEDIGRIRELLLGSLGAVRRNSMPFNQVLLELGQGSYITAVGANLQTKRLRFQGKKYLEFFEEERWTTELSNDSFHSELMRIALEQSQNNPRLIMTVEPADTLTDGNSN